MIGHLLKGPQILSTLHITRECQYVRRVNTRQDLKKNNLETFIILCKITWTLSYTNAKIKNNFSTLLKYS